MESVKMEQTCDVQLITEVDFQRFYENGQTLSDDESDEDDVIKFVPTSKSLISTEGADVNLDENQLSEEDVMSDIIETIKQNIQHHSASNGNRTAIRKSAKSTKYTDHKCKQTSNRSNINQYEIIPIKSDDNEEIEEDDGKCDDIKEKFQNILNDYKPPEKILKLNDSSNAKFSLDTDYSGYIRTAKYIVVKFECPQDDCPVMFQSKDDYDDHMATLHRYNPRYQCLYQKCGMIFGDDASFIKHTKMHTDMYQCSKCDTKEANYQDMNRHMIDYHQLGIFKCIARDCLFSAVSRIEAVNHYHQHHYERFACDWLGCLKTFSNLHQLKFHKMSHYNRRPRSNSPRPFPCPFENCGKSFISKAHLQEHERTHTGVKPFCCKYEDCMYAAKTRSSVMSHIRRHHFKLSDSVEKGKLKMFDEQHNPMQYLEIKTALL